MYAGVDAPSVRPARRHPRARQSIAQSSAQDRVQPRHWPQQRRSAHRFASVGDFPLTTTDREVSNLGGGAAANGEGIGCSRIQGRGP
jgi:hypothetical protein